MACFTTEIGKLDRVVVTLWFCKNPGGRESRRKIMLAAPRWQRYGKRIVGLTDVHSTRILNPVSCYQLQ
jgi:hypothetical protein